MNTLLALALVVGLSMPPARGRAGFFVDHTAYLDGTATTVSLSGDYACAPREGGTLRTIVLRYVTIEVQVRQRVRGRTVAASGATGPLLELACSGDPEPWRVAARAHAPLREGLATVQAVARLYGIVWGLPCFGARHTRLLAQARSDLRVALSHRLLLPVRRLNDPPRPPSRGGRALARPGARASYPQACFL